jgi:hypothetical protein
VLYLVDARVLEGSLKLGKRRNWSRLEDDAGVVGGWLQANRMELCLVVVTHIDQDTRLRKLGEEEYRELVITKLDPLTLKLGGPRKVRILIGSLRTLRDAQAVTSSVMREIISWEKGK